MEQAICDYPRQSMALQYLALLAGKRLVKARTAMANMTRHPRAGALRIFNFARGRLGTMLLASLLASTGHFTAPCEPLRIQMRKVQAPLRHLRDLGRLASGNSVVAYVKGPQLVRTRRRAVDPPKLQRGTAVDGWTVVYITRGGRAKQVLRDSSRAATGA